MLESSYRERVQLLARRKAGLEERRLDAFERALDLEAAGARPGVVNGHRRHAEQLEELIAVVDREIEKLHATLESGVATWVDGEPALPDLPEISPLRPPDSQRASSAEDVPPPQTAAGRRLARAQARRRAPRLSVLAAACGRAGRSALEREVRQLEQWLEVAGHDGKVEIAPVHAHRFTDLEPAFRFRAPLAVHLVGAPRRGPEIIETVAPSGEGGFVNRRRAA